MKYILMFFTYVAVHSVVNAQTKIDSEKVLLLKSENKNIQLVDVRTPAELNKTGKIEGAIIINYSESDFESKIIKLNKEKPVVVYCAAGGRSAKAAAILSKNGFKTVYDYSGGMSDWVAKGLKIVR